MPKIATYDAFDKSQIKKTCQKLKILDYEIREDGTVDVDGSVEITKKYKTIPLKFGIVNGDFVCNGLELTSLEGSPRIVEGVFDCSYNKLKSLQGGPEIVRGAYFDCCNNLLKSLKHGPKNVVNSYSCADNSLTSLEGMAQDAQDVDVSDNLLKNLKGLSKQTNVLHCSENQLISLEGCPESLEILDCSYNMLKSFKGGPLFIGSKLNISNNELKNLIGSPQGVYDFNCACNLLTSLEGCPERLVDFDCDENYLETLEGGPVEITNYYFAKKNNLMNLKGLPKYINNETRIYISPQNDMSYHFGSLDGFSRIADLIDDSYDKPRRMSLRKRFLYHQEDFKIWNDDNTLNTARLKLLFQFIKK